MRNKAYIEDWGREVEESDLRMNEPYTKFHRIQLKGILGIKIYD